MAIGIVDLPLKMVIIHSYVNVCQRVPPNYPQNYTRYFFLVYWNLWLLGLPHCKKPPIQATYSNNVFLVKLCKNSGACLVYHLSSFTCCYRGKQTPLFINQREFGTSVRLVHPTYPKGLEKLDPAPLGSMRRPLALRREYDTPAQRLENPGELVGKWDFLWIW